jgi:hypothetical protein
LTISSISDCAITFGAYCGSIKTMSRADLLYFCDPLINQRVRSRMFVAAQYGVLGCRPANAPEPGARAATFSSKWATLSTARAPAMSDLALDLARAFGGDARLRPGEDGLGLRQRGITTRLSSSELLPQNPSSSPAQRVAPRFFDIGKFAMHARY